jgi:hypothetical protein
MGWDILFVFNQTMEIPWSSYGAHECLFNCGTLCKVHSWTQIFLYHFNGIFFLSVPGIILGNNFNGVERILPAPDSVWGN